MSPNTKRARWMLEECAADYEFISVDLMSGEHKKPPYLELNPTGRVPTLVHEDLKLWESNAILVYLAETFPEKQLGGESPRERAEIMRMMFMNAAHLGPSVARIFSHTIRLPEAERMPKIAEQARAEVTRSLRPLEDALQEREYLGTGRFTIADVSVGATLAVAPMLGIDLSGHPNVRAWLGRMKARDAWSKVVAA